MKDVPLAVDLDGTLLCSDMLHESAIHTLRSNTLHFLNIPKWLQSGKGRLKEHLAEGMTLNPARLPYNTPFLDFLRREHREGRELILCTATHERLAQSIAAHLGIFSTVMATTGEVNLTGEVKAAALVARFGEQGFDYAGNSTDDLPVWAHARRAIVVNAPPDLEDRVRQTGRLEYSFARPPFSLSTLSRTLRLHQWVKNSLLIAPCAAAHRLDEPSVWMILLLAFLAFGACSSAVYLLNDLLDLENDRSHPRKRNRPLAAGTFSIFHAVLLIPVLLATSLLLGLMVNTAFLGLLVSYFTLTTAYSFLLKRLVLVDCLTLALLYTLRIIGGGLALTMPVSFWLLTFSIFLFLALAFVKRYAELLSLSKTTKETARGRAYHVADLPLIQIFGIASAYTSVLVLALYLNSEAVVQLYPHPLWLWLEIPVLTFWVSWLWLQTHRGHMHDDPVLFSIKDTASLASGAIFLTLLLIASLS